MAYGLNPRLFVENGPTLHAARTRTPRSSMAFRAWGALDADRRLKLIDMTLRHPANDLIDEFPVAL